MGRLNRGPNGPFSGKAGSIVGSSWRGIYYIKGLQKKITKPRSQAQIDQQNKFALAVKFLKPVQPVLDMGFSLINPGGATGYNMAISHLLQNCIKGNPPDFEIDYSSIVFCTKGKLSAPETVSMELNGMSLKLSWNTESNKYSSAGDKVEVLIHRPGLNSYQVEGEGINRGHGEMEFELSSGYGGDRVYVYMYMLSYDRKKWSNSVYVGEVKFR